VVPEKGPQNGCGGGGAITKRQFIYIVIDADDYILTLIDYEILQTIFTMVEYNVNMDKFEKRSVIKYLFLKGISDKAIHDDMLATLGDNARAYSVLKSWLAEFKRRRNSVEDKHRSGRPKDAASIENVQIVNDTLKEDRRLTIRYIIETTDIHALQYT